MMGEPTVTINTKEALADVFGMYNSPEKTRKLAGVRMRGFEPATPASSQPLKSLSFVQPTPQQNTETPAGSYHRF
jgi:checkpoint serine/threonine-protein kinase